MDTRVYFKYQILQFTVLQFYTKIALHNKKKLLQAPLRLGNKALSFISFMEFPLP